MQRRAQHVARRIEQPGRDAVDEHDRGPVRGHRASSAGRRGSPGYGSCAASRRSTASRTGCISGAAKSVAWNVGANPPAISSALRSRSGTSSWSARCSTISRLGRERPVSTKLRWRAEMPAALARSSWLRRRRVRQSRRSCPTAGAPASDHGAHGTDVDAADPLPRRESTSRVRDAHDEPTRTRGSSHDLSPRTYRRRPRRDRRVRIVRRADRVARRRRRGTRPRAAPASSSATSPATWSASPKTWPRAFPAAATPKRKPRRCAATRRPRSRPGCAPRSTSIQPLLDALDDDMWNGPSGVPDLTFGRGVLTLWYDAFVHADDIRAALGQPSATRRRPRRERRVPRRRADDQAAGARRRSRSTACPATTWAAADARSPATRCSSCSSPPAGPTPATMGLEPGVSIY